METTKEQDRELLAYDFWRSAQVRRAKDLAASFGLRADFDGRVVSTYGTLYLDDGDEIAEWVDDWLRISDHRKPGRTSEWDVIYGDDNDKAWTFAESQARELVGR